ncbi:carboxymuconolactone decarboxylase family protein [Rhizobium beringeri]
MNETASSSERYRRGMATRRAVLGDAHVDRAAAHIDGVRPPLSGVDHRSRLGLCLVTPGADEARERSIITIALLAALGQDDEVAMHVRATANTGGDARGYLPEALLHVAIYAGVPAANHVIKIAKQALNRWTPKRRPEGGTCPNDRTASPRRAASSPATAPGMRRR